MALVDHLFHSEGVVNVISADVEQDFLKEVIAGMFTDDESLGAQLGAQAQGASWWWKGHAHEGGNSFHLLVDAHESRLLDASARNFSCNCLQEDLLHPRTVPNGLHLGTGYHLGQCLLHVQHCDALDRSRISNFCSTPADVQSSASITGNGGYLARHQLHGLAFKSLRSSQAGGNDLLQLLVAVRLECETGKSKTRGDFT